MYYLLFCITRLSPFVIPKDVRLALPPHFALKTILLTFTKNVDCKS